MQTDPCSAPAGCVICCHHGKQAPPASIMLTWFNTGWMVGEGAPSSMVSNPRRRLTATLVPRKLASSTSPKLPSPIFLRKHNKEQAVSVLPSQKAAAHAALHRCSFAVAAQARQHLRT